MTFWQSIKTGFENGNIAKWTKAIGQATFTAGMTGAMINQMGKNNCCGGSIFGGGCFGGSYNMNMFGCGGNWFSPANPYVNPMMIGMVNPQNQMNAMNVQYGNQLAWNWGYQKGLEIRQNAAQQQSQLLSQQSQLFMQKTNNQYAGDISKDQSTEQGKAFDTKAKEMVDKEGNAVDKKSFEIVKDGLKDVKSADADQYRDAVTELGKSYLAEMDKTSGNSDGKVTLEEFIDHEMKNLPSDAPDNKKNAAKLQAQIAFNKIDQNGDGKVDYKELSAVFAALDADSDGKMDGIISSKEFEKNSKGLYEIGNTKFEQLLRKNYNDIFNNKKSDK